MAETTHSIFFFPNGVTAVCANGEQVPELQKSWLRMFMEWIEQNGIDPTQCEINMPNGQKAKMFRSEDGGSWRIQ